MSTENMEAPEIYSGKVGVEIVPDMRKLRSFAKDFIALVDSYWPENPGGVDEREQASQALNDLADKAESFPKELNPIGRWRYE